MTARNVTFTLGTAGRKAVRMDALKIVDNRLLGCTNSGGGKSWMLRKIVEQVGEKIPIIVLDPEGEFASLREKLDMVLCGADGEVEAHPRSAKLLCRKLIELRVSAVVDLYELKLPERRRFVREFLDALINLPRKLWGSTLIVLDEAHKYAPEKGQAESTDAVIGLMSQGRKRGFGGMLVTQRLSKLHKDAVGECNNYLLGRCVQDVDLKRQGDILGMGTKERSALRSLKPGEFYGFGPAFIDDGIVRFKTGAVETTHPDSRTRHKLKPPKASKKIRGVIGEFEGLADQSAKEARTEQELRARVTGLERDLAKAQRAVPETKTQTVEVEVVDQGAVERAVERAVTQHDSKWKKAVSERDRMWQRRLGAAITAAKNISPSVKTVGQAVEKIETAAAHIEGIERAAPEMPDIEATRIVVPKSSRAKAEAALNEGRSTREQVGREVAAGVLDRKAKVRSNANGSLNTTCRKLLSALSLHREGLNTKRLGFIAGLKTRGGGYNGAMRDLQDNAYIERDGKRWKITDSGVAALGDEAIDIPTTKEDRIEFWKGRLSNTAANILGVFIDEHPQKLTNADIGSITGRATRGGGYNGAMRELRDNFLITGKGEMGLNPEFLE